MRAVTITVHNNQKLEVFVRKLADGFEVFCAGLVRGRRVLIDHHLTRDDLEGHLKYAKPGDLIWRNAARSEIFEVAIGIEWLMYFAGLKLSVLPLLFC